jgi:Zn-finger nucleic acid-binding protein
MKCPQCKEHMRQSTIDKITINECLRCKGMWFDRGQLDTVKDTVMPEMGWLFSYYRFK